MSTWHMYQDESVINVNLKLKLMVKNQLKIHDRRIFFLFQSPIRAFDTDLERDEYYSDIFIGYGAALENSSFIGPNGSFYTEILTNHLKALTLE